MRKDLGISVKYSVRIFVKYFAEAYGSNKILCVCKGDNVNKMLSLFLLQIVILCTGNMAGNFVS